MICTTQETHVGIKDNGLKRNISCKLIDQMAELHPNLHLKETSKAEYISLTALPSPHDC
jgi:hypothetical protein